MGAFSLFATIQTPDGPARLPNTFAGVDHPFHATRAATLLAALADGEPLRWVAHHQGGYPVEFYPLGVAWLEIALWALALGALPIVVIYKLAVILIFLLPALAFVLLARRDRFPLAVALLAAAAHLAIPGDWDHGGYTELVQWGLVTNVAAATALLFVLAWLSDFLLTGHRLAGTGAALAAAFAVSTNPRSLIALAVLGLATFLAASLRPPSQRAKLPSPALGRGAGGEGVLGSEPVPRLVPPPTVPLLAGRLALVAALAALLAAPVLVSLLRFSDLYRFVQYQSYIDAADYLATSIAAVGRPVFALALAGLLAAWLLPGRPASRAAAAALLLYTAATLLFSTQPQVAALVPQLEATRLMPFQRFLTLYLAASALGTAATWLASQRHVPAAGPSTPTTATTDEAASAGFVGVARGFIPERSPRPTSPWLPTLLLVAATAATLLGYVAPSDAPVPVPAVDIPRRGLYPVVTTATPKYLDLQEALVAADEAAPPGTALLVLGSALSWHQPLWAPLWTDRPLYYNDWLWYWHPDHAGPPDYAFARGNNYPSPELALDPDFLARHGIGAIAVTDRDATTAPAAALARRSPALRPVRTGLYDVYAVRQPTTTVTFADQNASSTRFSGQHLTAAGTSPGGHALVRHNWHPRWRAAVNGAPAPTVRTADGYLRVPLPAGDIRLELTYVVEPWDWTARVLALAGLLGSAALPFSSIRSKGSS